jgi:H+/Cl- antiporter ClcA
MTTGVDYFFQLSQNLINIFYGLGILGGIFCLLYAGFKYITSLGQKTSEVHKEIIFAIIGLILIIISFVLPVIIYSFLK